MFERLSALHNRHGPGGLIESYRPLIFFVVPIRNQYFLNVLTPTRGQSSRGLGQLAY